jgi:nucleoside-diphosphate-sugar epimerase
MKDNIIIFGANGFVGSAVAELMKSKYNLKCIIRNQNSCSFLSNLGIQATICNSLDYKETLNVIDKSSIVINCVNGDYDTLVKSTKNIARACINKKAKKLIHISSTDVYGNSKGLIDENSKMIGNRGDYSKAKIDSENFLHDLEDRLQVIILRPGIIYGIGSSLWTNRIIERNLNGFSLPKKTEITLCNLTYINDLVKSIMNACSFNNGNITCNIISDDEITWKEYYFSYDIGKYDNKIKFKNNIYIRFIVLIQAPIRFIAKPILKYLRFLVNIMYQKNKYSNTLLKSTQSGLKANPDISELSLLITNVKYSNSKSKKELNMKYTSFKAGLKETEIWIKDTNLVQALFQL